MADLEKYTEDKNVRGLLGHIFRSLTKDPSNIEIDHTLSSRNYQLSPESHGTSKTECMKFYRNALKDTYIYGKNSDRNITRCIGWCIQAPDDLSPDKKDEFFRACYSFLTETYGEENCIIAEVHVDEIVRNKHGKRISKDHLHYLTVPKVQNKRYLSPEDKLISGFSKAVNDGLLEFDDLETMEKINSMAVQKKMSKKSTLQMIEKLIGCDYQRAKKIFSRCFRKESESCPTRLDSSALTSLKQLFEFHGNLQTYLDNHGIKCTVSLKSQGIQRNLSYTISEAKTVTRVTGYSIEEIKELAIENQRLKEKIKNMSKELEHEKNHEWGSTSGWKGEKSWEITY